jgi:LacI family transcriptional regulator
LVSMQQVADAAGVSPATVSRVLSNSGYPVREATRDRVLTAATELGFRPNLLARALATSRTTIVAVIVHDISDPYFGEIVRGIEDVARANGFQVLVSSSDRDPQRELEILELMLAYNVDAVIFSGGSLHDGEYEHECRRLFDSFVAQGRAVVHLGPHHVKATRVAIDNEAAAAGMTAYLAELGHTRIALLDGPPQLSTAGVRAKGYRKGLASAGLEHDPELVVPGGFTAEGGRAAAAALLDAHPEVTAIFASNDLMALGAMSELRARHLHVPGAVSVAGFDDVPAVQYAWPPLTTVAVPMRQLGQIGFEVVLRILDGQRVRSRTLPTELVIRGSTGPPPRKTASATKSSKTKKTGPKGTTTTRGEPR